MREDPTLLEDARGRVEPARAVLLEHVASPRTGTVSDPADWAAVVTLERLAAEVGADDPSTLQALLAGDGTASVHALVDEALDRVAVGLVRRERGQRVDSGVLNAAAGHHSVTTDAALLRAAARAAHASFTAMPYYGARYGARGSRFAGTDSAWLASLAALPPEPALRQVLWLSRVLATRGMPSWLMERHLADLSTWMERTAGSGAGGSLPVVAAALTAERVAVCPDDLLERAEERVALVVGADRPVPHAGRLGGAADVRLGRAVDTEPLLAWLAAPEQVDDEAAVALREVASWVDARLG